MDDGSYILRMPAATKRRIKAAAAIRGLSMKDFILDAVTSSDEYSRVGKAILVETKKK